MRYAFHNEDYVLAITLRVDGEEVVSDDETISWTLYDSNRTSLLTGSLSSLGASQLVITIPAANNQKVKTFEARFLEYSFSYNDAIYTFTEPYRIVTWFPIQPHKADIIAALGLDNIDAVGLAPDAYAAYEWLESRVLGSISAQLIAGGTDAAHWNNAIRFKAAADLIPALRISLIAKDQADNIAQSRFKVDFEVLFQDLMRSVYESITAGITASNGVISLADIPTTLASFATPVDVITGV